MDLALNTLQRLIVYKTQQTKPNQTEPLLYKKFRCSQIFVSILNFKVKKN